MSKTETNARKFCTGIAGALAIVVTATVTANAQPPIPDQLVGEWSYGGASLLQYVNPQTGATRPGYGAGATYEFKSDGTFRYAQVMQIGESSCNSNIFTYKVGAFDVTGDAINLHIKKTTVDGNLCGKGEIHQVSGPEEQTKRWSLGPDGDGGSRPMLTVDALSFSKDK